jgi:hypothetical protein
MMQNYINVLPNAPVFLNSPSLTPLIELGISHHSRYDVPERSNLENLLQKIFFVTNYF